MSSQTERKSKNGASIQNECICRDAAKYFVIIHHFGGWQQRDCEDTQTRVKETLPLPALSQWSTYAGTGWPALLIRHSVREKLGGTC